MAAWWIYFYDKFKPISGLARSPVKLILVYLVGKSFWTLDSLNGDVLVLTQKGKDTIALIKKDPLLSSVTIEVASDIKNCGLTFSIQDLAKDKNLNSTALTLKAWDKGAKSINRFLHNKSTLKSTLSFSEKHCLLKIKVISKIQHLGHSTICSKETRNNFQTNLNHFVFGTKNPPIPAVYAGLPIEQGGYEYISVQKILNAIAISSIREFLDETLPPPVQKLMTCSLISLLSIKFDLIQMAPLLNNPTFLMDAVLLMKDVIKEKMFENMKLKIEPPNILEIWRYAIMVTLPSLQLAKRRFNPTVDIDILPLKQEFFQNLLVQPIFFTL